MAFGAGIGGGIGGGIGVGGSSGTPKSKSYTSNHKAKPSVLLIEALVAPSLRVDRSVELHGPGLPFQGAQWSTKMKLTTTWNPGNGDDATQHVLGPEELPSKWEGFWRTTRMVAAPSIYVASSGGSGQKVTTASTLREILDDIFRSGALLRVTWAADEGRKIVRVGRAAQWDFGFDRMDDIKWSVEFAWKGRGRQVQRVVSFIGDDMQAATHDLNVALSGLVGDLSSASIVSAMKGLPLSASSFSLGDLEALADGPLALVKSVTRLAQSIVNRIERIGALVAKIGALPQAIEGQVLDATTNAYAVMSQLDDQLSRVPAELKASHDAKVSQALAAAAYFDGASERAAEAAAVAAQFRRKLLAKKASSSTSPGQGAGAADMQAVYVARQGDTFAGIAKRYFHTPDVAGAIAMANGFPSYQVAPPIGTPLVIPNLAAQQALTQV